MAESMTARELEALRHWWALQPPVLERIERILAAIASRVFNWSRAEGSDALAPSDFLYHYQPPPAVDPAKTDEHRQRAGLAAAAAIAADSHGE